MIKRLVCSLFLTLAFVSCHKKTGPSFAFITNGVAQFWAIAEQGAKAAGRDLGVHVSVHMPTGGLTDQKRIVEDLLVRGVDGIAISPIDPDNQIQFLNHVASQTKLITQDSDAPSTKRLLYVGMDNYVAGMLLGKLLKERMPNGGTVVTFLPRMEQDNLKRRRQGFIDELLSRAPDPRRFDPPDGEISANGFTVRATLTDQLDRAKAKANCEDILTKYRDIGALVGLAEYNGALCMEAIKQSGRVGNVKLVGFDEPEVLLDAIADGSAEGTVVQDPFRYGYESIKILKKIHDGDPDVIPVDKFFDIPARTIVRDNVEAFRKDLQAKLDSAK